MVGHCFSLAIFYSFPLTSYYPLNFNSVEQILTQLETQPGWEKFRQHRQLLKSWDRIVNKQTAKHTRPLYVNRQILYVATSSAARAQELYFQRYTLLKRLNKLLTFEVEDIRFSSSQWHQKSYSANCPTPLFTISDRQSTKANSQTTFTPKLAKSNKEQDNTRASDRAKIAAQRWLESIKQRTSNSFLCPNCKSAASAAELNRWNMCHHCAAQEWSDEYSPATFPEIK